jgi:hypothetical protein
LLEGGQFLSALYRGNKALNCISLRPGLTSNLTVFLKMFKDGIKLIQKIQFKITKFYDGHGPKDPSELSLIRPTAEM